MRLVAFPRHEKILMTYPDKSHQISSPCLRLDENKWGRNLADQESYWYYSWKVKTSTILYGDEKFLDCKFYVFMNSKLKSTLLNLLTNKPYFGIFYIIF